MTTGIRKDGEFCWFNMLTPDPANARDFFSSVLGWRYVDMPGMGHRAQVQGRDVGALFDLASPGTPTGTPPLIGLMVKVENADDMGARVAALGGHAKPAFDVGPPGRMAVCFDPLGAEFDVWQPGTSQGTTVDSHARGAPSWFETLTSDVARASRFYTELFGWTAETTRLPGGDYTTFSLDSVPIAGAMAISREMKHVKHSHWGTYFAVPDADETLRRVVTHGGTVCVPLQAIPVGRFAGIQSPQGVVFYVVEYAV
jgi:hypothetical protein